MPQSRQKRSGQGQQGILRSYDRVGQFLGHLKLQEAVSHGVMPHVSFPLTCLLQRYALAFVY